MGSNIEAIKAAIEVLPKTDYAAWRQWFSEKDWENWDRQIEADSKSGKFDFLIAGAKQQKEQGMLKDL